MCLCTNKNIHEQNNQKHIWKAINYLLLENHYSQYAQQNSPGNFEEQTLHCAHFCSAAVEQEQQKCHVKCCSKDQIILGKVFELFGMLGGQPRATTQAQARRR